MVSSEDAHDSQGVISKTFAGDGDLGDEDPELGLVTGHVRTFLFKQNLEASAVEQLFMTGTTTRESHEADMEGNISGGN